jgi:hypothetical protein
VVTNLFHLKVVIQSPDHLTNIPTDYVPPDPPNFDYELSDNNIKSPPVNGYDWCQTCHIGSMGNKKTGCHDCHYHGSSGKW